jgi:hypothetical protein
MPSSKNPLYIPKIPKRFESLIINDLLFPFQLLLIFLIELWQVIEVPYWIVMSLIDPDINFINNDADEDVVTNEPGEKPLSNTRSKDRIAYDALYQYWEENTRAAMRIYPFFDRYSIFVGGGAVKLSKGQCVLSLWEHRVRDAFFWLQAWIKNNVKIKLPMPSGSNLFAFLLRSSLRMVNLLISVIKPIIEWFLGGLPMVLLYGVFTPLFMLTKLIAACLRLLEFSILYLVTCLSYRGVAAGILLLAGLPKVYALIKVHSPFLYQLFSGLSQALTAPCCYVLGIALLLPLLHRLLMVFCKNPMDTSNLAFQALPDNHYAWPNFIAALSPKDRINILTSVTQHYPHTIVWDLMQKKRFAVLKGILEECSPAVLKAVKRLKSKEQQSIEACLEQAAADHQAAARTKGQQAAKAVPNRRKSLMGSFFTSSNFHESSSRRGSAVPKPKPNLAQECLDILSKCQADEMSEQSEKVLGIWGALLPNVCTGKGGSFQRVYDLPDDHLLWVIPYNMPVILSAIVFACFSMPTIHSMLAHYATLVTASGVAVSLIYLLTTAVLVVAHRKHQGLGWSLGMVPEGIKHCSLPRCWQDMMPAGCFKSKASGQAYSGLPFHGRPPETLSRNKFNT